MPALDQTDEKTLYETLIQKESDIFKSMSSRVEQMPNIPVVKEWISWKVKDAEAMFTLSSGIDTETGVKLETMSERIQAFARKEARALGSGIRSTADVFLFLSNG